MEVEAKLLQPGSYVLCVEALWNKCAQNSDYQAFCVKIQAKTSVNLKE